MKDQGFTLIELLVVSSIFITLVALAIPTFKESRERAILSAASSKLLSSIHLARSRSINLSKDVILCGSIKGTECDQQWSKGIMVFIDNNHDGSYDDENDARESFRSVDFEKLSISWKSFRGDKPIKFLPSGITWHQNGTFILCLDNNPKYAKAITLTKSGRARLSIDSDNDGIDELRDEKPIECSKQR
ncbi:MAG: GspH/FimT family pseudopilin [Kangiellaceae bacterium]|jgi:type IV fimbrial biogenesis protein FimT|nr:GspH/FimT family pseudopilin [Kangiellaceae bacterium]